MANIELPKLEPHRMGLAEHRMNTFAVSAEPNVTKADLLRPDYWSHVARQLRVTDKVLMTTEDGSIYAEMLVIACDRLWAKMHILQWINLQTRDVSETQASAAVQQEDYSIEWKGNQRKHVVIRNSDQQVIHEGDQTKQAAVAWLADYLKITA